MRVMRKVLIHRKLATAIALVLVVACIVDSLEVVHIVDVCRLIQKFETLRFFMVSRQLQTLL